jgi:hypothetical protein
LFAANDASPAVEPVAEEPGDMDQDAISALFAANNGESEAPEPASDSEPEPDEDFVAAIVEAKSKAAEPGLVTSEDLEDDTDMPAVNLVQFNSGGGVEAEGEEGEVVDDFDADDIDASLIAAILEGKDVDPSL